MPDLFDYLAWRGDLPFSRDGFQEPDNLIFASLTYVMFDGVIPQGSDAAITLRQAAEQYTAMGGGDMGSPFLTSFPALFLKAAKTERFGAVRLSRYVNEVSVEAASQFCAMVFSISDTEHYIAFRGTDGTLAGWKEDFLMGFQDTVLAQSLAAVYVNRVIPKLRGTVYLGGHSKGGNLAVYSAAHAAPRNRARIKTVYNNDGPGFLPGFIESEGYRGISGKIHTLVPKSSVVGMLLEHGVPPRIVRSTETGIMAHSSLTWEVRGPDFLYEKELTKQSVKFAKSLRLWLENLSISERATFVDALFDIIDATGAQTLSDLSRERLSMADTMIRKLMNLDKPTKKLLRTAVLAFFRERQRVAMESFGAGSAAPGLIRKESD